MLGIKIYTREYIDSCRSRVESDLEAYRGVAARQPAGDAAGRAFEARFFNNLVLLLDAFFVHRLRTVEGKDGNPLNEVRVLCNSMLLNNNVMTSEKGIKLTPSQSVLKLEFGEEIRLTEADFLLLSNAYFAEIESKFS